MKRKTVHNTSDKNIDSYKIEEAKTDSSGEIVVDKGSGRPKWTGKTLKWTIMAGETLEFPAYVADYLMGIYPFLHEVKEKSEKEEKKEATAVDASKFDCKYCGKNMKDMRALAFHMAGAHAKEVTK